MKINVYDMIYFLTINVHDVVYFLSFVKRLTLFFFFAYTYFAILCSWETGVQGNNISILRCFVVYSTIYIKMWCDVD